MVSFWKLASYPAKKLVNYSVYKSLKRLRSLKLIRVIIVIQRPPIQGIWITTATNIMASSTLDYSCYQTSSTMNIQSLYFQSLSSFGKVLVPYIEYQIVILPTIKELISIFEMWLKFLLGYYVYLYSCERYTVQGVLKILRDSCPWGSNTKGSRRKSSPPHMYEHFLEEPIFKTFFFDNVL